jgi:hypothetical protein
MAMKVSACTKVDPEKVQQMANLYPFCGLRKAQRHSQATENEGVEVESRLRAGDAAQGESCKMIGFEARPEGTGRLKRPQSITSDDQMELELRKCTGTSSTI